MQPTTAREYLETMGEEGSPRREARALVIARLNGVELRWKQRAQERAFARGEPDLTVESVKDGMTTLRETPKPEDAEYMRFFRRLHGDPTFWDAYGRRLSEPGAPRWAKRRRAHISIWLELLTRGETSPRRLALNDAKVDFDGLSDVSYERLLEERASPEAPPYLLDGSVAKGRRPGREREFDPPTASRGIPADEELRRMHKLSWDGYTGSPAVEHRSDHAGLGRESRYLHPQFVASLTTFRDEALQRIEPLLKDEETAPAAATLRDDLKFRWWPLRALHHIVSQDVALEWWLTLEPKGRGQLLDSHAKVTFDTKTANRLIRIHKSALREPILSDDAVALILISSAGSLGRVWPAPATARARLAAASACRQLSLSPRLQCASYIEIGSAHRELGDAKKAAHAMDAARAALGGASDEYLERFLEHGEDHVVHVHSQSIGGSAYYEIIGIR